MSTCRFISLLSILTLALLTLSGELHAGKTKLSFSGGPDGGTFQYFSNGIASRLSREVPGFEISHLPSAGSVENIRRVDAGESDFGIAYSGDTFLARKGALGNDPQQFRNVRVMAYLYGAPAHLVTLATHDIHKVADLAGLRVAVGGAGSGAAAAAKRYFTALGLWSRMKVQFIGYNKAARALTEGRIDAMWVFAGFPNASVTQVAAKQKIRLLDTWEAGLQAGVFKQYPFYSPVTIPAGTYPGLNKEIRTFQDSALWVAGKQVLPETAYRSLSEIFSPKGLAYMIKVKSTAKAMSVAGALTGVVTPVHQGARKFWQEQGLTFIPGE